VELDAIDRTILRMLQQNGRTTNAALAEAVGLTATPMLQRVRKLEQLGVITRYSAVVDPAKLGRAVVAFVAVTLKNHKLAHHERFLELVAGLSEVLECHHVAGDDDYLLKIAVSDIAAVERFLLHRLSASDVIGRVRTTFVLSSSRTHEVIEPLDAQEES
jgi:Lrp/AsnC family leucine-responsive transcriptional regulator